MKAMVLKHLAPLDVSHQPLELSSLPDPTPSDDELLIRVTTCGVCHTELDEIEGRMPPPTLPLVLGHQVIGTVATTGPRTRLFKPGDRVGVAWIFSACGQCTFCQSGNENLCVAFRATGRDAYGGYAEYMTAREDFCHSIPSAFSDSEAAPLLCAGAIGFRSLRLAKLRDGQNLGLVGFGASAHLVLKLIHWQYPNIGVFVFTRSPAEREFAIELGAAWAGDIDDTAPNLMESIIDTTPAWHPVVSALRNLGPGGRLVINAIRKEESDKQALLEIDYPTHLWMEKEIKSVANVTRADVREFLDLAARIPIKPEFQEYDLTDANQALAELKGRKIRGAKVLRVR